MRQNAKVLGVLLGAGFLVASLVRVDSASAQSDFYKGKTITVYAGTTPGAVALRARRTQLIIYRNSLRKPSERSSISCKVIRVDRKLISPSSVVRFTAAPLRLKPFYRGNPITPGVRKALSEISFRPERNVMPSCPRRPRFGS